MKIRKKILIGALSAVGLMTSLVVASNAISNVVNSNHHKQFKKELFHSDFDEIWDKECCPTIEDVIKELKDYFFKEKDNDSDVKSYSNQDINEINELIKETDQSIIESEKLIKKCKETLNEIDKLLISFYIIKLWTENYPNLDSFATKFDSIEWKEDKKNKPIIEKLANLLKCSFDEVNKQKIKQLVNGVLFDNDGDEEVNKQKIEQLINE